MSKRLFSQTLSRFAFLFCFEFLVSFVQTSHAADALNYFKNYFVTGDYVVGGVGLRGLGMFSAPLGGSFATGTINIGGAGPVNGVPAEIVAAFLYWETEESAPSPVAMKGFFDGHPIVGKILGNPNNPACWSSGGTSGSAVAAGRVYRADVLRYLAIDPVNNVRLANGPHIVSLPDSGGNGNGNILFTDGASLVVIYRIVVPGQPLIAPLRSVVVYDGTYTMSKGSPPMTQIIGGFYQASSNAAAQMTPIAGNGQSDFVETISVNGLPLNLPKSPFRGIAGGRWDNPTFSINLAQNDASYSTQITSGGNQVCLTFAAIVTSTNVTDTDHDGLLDKWETNGLHLNPGGPGQPATFGGCSDYQGEPCVDLPSMGAKPGKQDIFIEIDWMHGTDGHLHIPKIDALNAIGATFANHNIAVHFDVGNNYQNLKSPYIIPAPYGQGGEVIEEDTLRCQNLHPAACAYYEPYAVASWKKGFHAVKDGLPSQNPKAPPVLPSHFARNRKDAFHYVLFGHALAGPFGPNGKPLSPDPSSVSGVADRSGGDVMVTLGLWRFDDPAGCDPTVNCADQTGTALVQAGTLMHELGHNLNLSHAGQSRLPNCIPNYPSVMNYLYQTRGLTDALGNEHIDFSSGSLKKYPLDENSLSKFPTAMGPLNYRVRFFGPLAAKERKAPVHCDGTPIKDGAAEIRLESPGLSTPDWNRTGRSDDGPVSSYDVNFNGSIVDVMVDSDDWDSLNLQQIGARENAAGLSADIGDADLGDADLGDADLGDADLGDADLGDADLGDADLGDISYDTAIASLDATSSSNPLTATSKTDRITLTWGAPSLGLIRTYTVYRSDGTNVVPLPDVNGQPPATTTDDIVNDFVNSGASCPVTSTCYNTFYTYFLIATDSSGNTSSQSNNTLSVEVPHIFVIADNQNTVYGNPNPALSFHVFGDVSASLDKTTVNCVISPVALKYNAGNYGISCSGPSQTSPVDGVTYNASYNDGVTLHTQGALNITPKPITVTAVTNTKTYDANTSAGATPTMPAGSLSYTDTAVWNESYSDKNAGVNNKTLIPAGAVNDGNGGQNYAVTFVNFTTGTTYPAPLTITALTNTKPYDVTTSASAIPNVSGLKGSDTVTGLAETYDTKDAGIQKTLSVTAYTINDGNSGHNYTVSKTDNRTGVITQVYAIIEITPYKVSFDGTAHTATGTATGVVSLATGVREDLSAYLNLAGTTHTQPGDYPSDPWVFSGATNYYNANGAVGDHIFGFVATGSMSTPRSFHTATLLGNKKVLVVGGFDSKGAPLASAELYDTDSNSKTFGTFSPTTNNMPNKAAGHTATLLQNGRVLVVGGGNSSSQIYDPTSNTWSSAGGIGGQRSYHSATLLPGGKVLIAGGSDQSGKTINSAILYDPSTGAYSNTGNMTVSRDFHTATPLPDGTVLIAGGRTSSGSGYMYQASAEIYDPTKGTFAAVGAMGSARYGHSAIVLSNGQVLVAGGASTAAIASAELYDPVAGVFSSTSALTLTTPRQYFTAMPFYGSIVEAGGLNGSTRLQSAEQYQGGTFLPMGNMTAPRAAYTATVLSDGKTVLITGGQGSTGSSVSSAELLQ
jgi:hypothetical protein